jgi:hypothetical protein
MFSSGQVLVVDTPIEVITNALPLSPEGNSIDETIAFDETGMEVYWNCSLDDGTVSVDAITPTAAGVYDWAHVDGGTYKIEIPATGGASANNDEEGTCRITGRADGILIFGGPYYTITSAEQAGVINGTLLTRIDIDNSTGSISAAQIETDAITSTQIATNAIGAAEIATDAIGVLEAGFLLDSTGFNGADIAAILADTGTTLNDFVDDLETRLTTARAGYLDNLNISENVAGTSEITALNDLDATAVQTAAAAALTAYDPPTNAELNTLIGSPTDTDIATDLVNLQTVADRLYVIEAGTARNIVIGQFISSADNVTPITTGTPVCTVSINAVNSYAAIDDTETAVGPRGFGIIEISDAETTSAGSGGVIFLSCTLSNARTVDITIYIQ